MWTVILNFSKSNVQIFRDLTAHQAEQMVHVVVFHNKDCIDVSILKQNQEDPRDQPDYPNE